MAVWRIVARHCDAIHNFDRRLGDDVLSIKSRRRAKLSSKIICDLLHRRIGTVDLYRLFAVRITKSRHGNKLRGLRFQDSARSCFGSDPAEVELGRLVGEHACLTREESFR